jgi:hypothetical protein
MEEAMAETAVGLFEDSSTATAVVEALRANGLPENTIRTLSMPAGMAVDSSTSTPGVDFAAALARDLHAMGATDEECQAYVAGARRGNSLVFATGTRVQADTAISVMNAYDPIEIEELAGVASSLPGIHQGEVGAHESISLKTDHARAQSEGARVFSW